MVGCYDPNLISVQCTNLAVAELFYALSPQPNRQGSDSYGLQSSAQSTTHYFRFPIRAECLGINPATLILSAHPGKALRSATPEAIKLSGLPLSSMGFARAEPILRANGSSAGIEKQVRIQIWPRSFEISKTSAQIDRP